MNTEHLYRELNLDINIEGLREAIINTDMGEGTHIHPMSLDLFVKNDLKGIFEITEGEGFVLNLNFQDESYTPSLRYLKFRNLKKGLEEYMTKNDWQTYFEIEDNDPNKLVSPDGVLFLKPTTQNGNQSFEILTKEHDLIILEDLYLSYTVVMSLLIEDKTYFFRIDPFVKVTSKVRA